MKGEKGNRKGEPKKTKGETEKGNGGQEKKEGEREIRIGKVDEKRQGCTVYVIRGDRVAVGVVFGLDWQAG